MHATLAESYGECNSILPVAFKLAGCYRAPMDIIEIRRARLLWLARLHGGFAGLGELSGTDPNYFSQIKTGVRNMGHGTARHLEKVAGLPHGTMDTPLAEDERRRNVEELIQTALGAKAVNPEHKGPIKKQPRPFRGGLPASTGDRPKEGHQTAPSAARKGGRKRSAT